MNQRTCVILTVTCLVVCACCIVIGQYIAAAIMGVTALAAVIVYRRVPRG